mmetsp:Transcript_101087/g.240905  ORF Transcript_101087/g.240905 Transcript_101087/m.240905 type:complete len:222 (+) Transcript_101087:1355-2020(+)
MIQRGKSTDHRRLAARLLICVTPVGFGGRHELVAQKGHQLHGVGQILQAHQGRRQPAPPGPRRAPAPVDEELGAGGEVKVQHVIQQRDIHPSSRHICRDQDPCLLLPELGHLLLAGRLVHGAIDDGRREALLLQELSEELHVMLGGYEHDGGLLVLVETPQDGDCRRDLLVLAREEVPKVQGVTQGCLHVQAHEDGILDASSRKGDQLSRQGRRKEQALPG